MSALLARGKEFALSLAGRIALILICGIMATAFGSLLIANQARRLAIQHAHAEAVVTSAIDVVDRIERDRAGTLASLQNGTLLGANLVLRGSVAGLNPNSDLTATLRKNVDSSLAATLSRASDQLCLANDPFRARARTAGFRVPLPSDCWLLSMHQSKGSPLRVVIKLPRLPPPPSPFSDPVFVCLAAIATTVLAAIVARLATRPLRRLVDAAEAFARSIDAPPVNETGPVDVRRALRTFNVMQGRVREGVRERTRMLASISHDLQTPLTRLRLRLEQVGDEPLREKLVADLNATLKMVQRGLDLARSSESAEDWSTVALDTMLSSIAEDAAEFEQPVRFDGGSGSRVRVKPDALSRCLTNLIGNAVKYGGGAELRSEADGRRVVISIRDHGPGMSDETMARAFKPFVRGDVGRSDQPGTGIGLAIAKAQAAATGGVLTLRNHPAGGLIASLTLEAVG